MAMLLALTDEVTALFLDYPLGAIMCIVCLLVIALLILLWISLIGYNVVDRAFRRKISRHVLIVGKCFVPEHEETIFAGANSDTGVVEFNRVLVPDEWRVMVQTDGKKGMCLVTKAQFEVVGLGNRPLARFYIGRFSRQVFVLEIKI